MGIPTWIVFLAVLPFTGLGVMPCLLGASVLAVGAVVWAERRRARRIGGVAPERPAAAAAGRPMSALAAAGLTLGAVAVLAYIVLVIRAA